MVEGLVVCTVEKELPTVHFPLAILGKIPKKLATHW
jgi:hypothetical protein